MSSTTTLTGTDRLAARDEIDAAAAAGGWTARHNGHGGGEYRRNGGRDGIVLVSYDTRGAVTMASYDVQGVVGVIKGTDKPTASRLARHPRRKRSPPSLTYRKPPGSRPDMESTLAKPRSTNRGAGGRTCCPTHRDRCLIGHAHFWSTWYENGRLMRTEDTYSCHRCGGTCTADETEDGSEA